MAKKSTSKPKKKDEVTEYMDYVRNFLIKKWGYIPDAWKISLIQLEDYLYIYKQAKKDVQERSITVMDRFESPVVNPNIKVMQDASIRIEKIISSFGLSPYADKKINEKVDKGTENDVLDKLMMADE